MTDSNHDRITIVLARLVPFSEVLSTEGLDLGHAPKTRIVNRPEALVWLLDGHQLDYRKACDFADKNGYCVFTYETTEPDPLGRAKQDILSV